MSIAKAGNIFYSQKGLTLVELVVVSALLALMAGVLFGTVNGIIQSRNTIERRLSITRTARYVLTQIREDLRARVLETVIGDDDSRGTSGNQYQATYLVGRHQERDRYSADTITFVTQNSATCSADGTTVLGNAEVTYYLSTDRLRGESAAVEHSLGSILIRSSVPAGIKDKNLRDKRRLSFTIADSILALRFRYFLAGQWSDQWLAGQGRLPDAVEIALDIGSSEEDLQHFKMLVALNSDPQPLRSKSSGD
jgi:prepilin-type N-terminal cleavage/methylation domain-containing protein